MYSKIRYIHHFIQKIRRQQCHQLLSADHDNPDFPISFYNKTFKETLGNTWVELSKSKPQLEKLETSQILEILKIMQENGIRHGASKDQATILAQNPYFLQQVIDSLKEMDVINPTPHVIANYKSFLERNLSELVGYKHSKSPMMVVDRYLRTLQLPESHIKKLKWQIQHERLHLVPLLHLKKWACYHFFLWKFRIDQKVEQLAVKQLVEAVRWQSLRQTREITSVLADVLQIMPQDISKKTSYQIVKVDPAALKDACRLCSKIGSYSLKKLFEINPEVLFNPEYIPQNLQTLEEYSVPIPSDPSKKSLLVFRVPPTNLKIYLCELSQYQEFSIMKQHENFLEIFHINNFLSKLVKLVKAKSLTVEGFFDNSFELLDRNNKDLNKGFVIANYISDKIGSDFIQVKARLSTNSHWTQVDPIKVKMTLQYLLDKKYTKQQILNAAPLVLYPEKTVQTYVEQLHSVKELQPLDKWKTHDMFLHLVLYYIEKDHYYSKEGVFFH